MITIHDGLLVFTGFISEVLGTISGFGSSTFFVPIALFFESFQLVLALTSILHCFGNLTRILIFRQHFDWSLFFSLALPSIVLTGLGAFLTTIVKVKLAKVILGLALIFISLFLLFGKRWAKKLPMWAAILFSGVSGLLTGFVGTGGAIRGITLAAIQIEKNSFVVLSAAIDIGGDLLRAIIYLSNGFMDWSHWFYIPLLGFAAYLGARLGKMILGHVNQSQFEKMVSFFVLLSGVMLVLGGAD